MSFLKNIFPWKGGKGNGAGMRPTPARKPENLPPPNLGSNEFVVIRNNARQAWSAIVNPGVEWGEPGVSVDPVEDFFVSFMARHFVTRLKQGLNVSLQTLFNDDKDKVQGMLDESMRKPGAQDWNGPRLLAENPYRIAAVAVVVWKTCLADYNFRTFFLSGSEVERENALNSWTKYASVIFQKKVLPCTEIGVTATINQLAGVDEMLEPRLRVALGMYPEEVLRDHEARRTGKGIEAIVTAAAGTTKGIKIKPSALAQDVVDLRTRMEDMAACRGWTGVPAAVYMDAVSEIGTRLFLTLPINLPDIVNAVVARSFYTIRPPAARAMVVSAFSDILNDSKCQYRLEGLDIRARSELMAKWRELAGPWITGTDPIDLIVMAGGNHILLDGAGTDMLSATSSVDSKALEV